MGCANAYVASFAKRKINESSEKTALLNQVKQGIIILAAKSGTEDQIDKENKEILFYNEQAVQILNPKGGTERYETESD